MGGVGGQHTGQGSSGTTACGWIHHTNTKLACNAHAGVPAGESGAHATKTSAISRHAHARKNGRKGGRGARESAGRGVDGSTCARVTFYVASDTATSSKTYLVGTRNVLGVVCGGVQPAKREKHSGRQRALDIPKSYILKKIE